MLLEFESISCNSKILIALLARIQALKITLDDSSLSICLVSAFGTIDKEDLQNIDYVKQVVDIFTLDDFDFADFIDSDIVIFDPMECLFWKYVDLSEQENLRKNIEIVISSLLRKQKIVILTSNLKGVRYYDFLSQHVQKIKI